ncbi:hypothetical protein D9758_016854 [Tetrapyrgos nigripes]|uniref:Uncharacterized protein n=1 Tax=Tetrapyrgos nigripes TaxID=182062 RepID=A0A8H5CFI5_9AGAR|nr:hypothetical protein D9758_016983 [Tetrapyrgos nigripes]KAF5340141.1 hypothetical protein D9758_016854 [Tetrapyrgos nigripes]
MHGITWDEDAEREKVAREWVETSVTELKKTEGWVRTRTFRVIDSLKMGLGIPEGPEAQKVPIYLAVHELLTPEAAESYTQQVGYFYLSHESYTRLSANRPPREAALVKNL